MLPRDGGTEESDRPVVSLVRFGAVEPDLAGSLVRSIDGFFCFLGMNEDLQPEIRQSRRRLPTKIPYQYQGDFLLSYIEDFSGNIVVGVTDIAFYDPNLPRNVFGYGSSGRGVLSTYRFRRESENRGLLYERLNKEIIKILALACDLPRCHDNSCVVVYHRTMVDIDRNKTVCLKCRQTFVRSLESYLGDRDHG
jgi:predicted Zn-dependent protease